MSRIILSIDQGAKNTGCLFGQEGDTFKALVLTLNENNIHLSQAERRTKRHQKRNILRRKRAKRLLKVILEKKFSIDIAQLSEEQRQFLFGLLNRRGFNYFVEELNEEEINALDMDFLVHIFPSLDNEVPLFDQLMQNATDVEWYENIVNSESFRFTNKRQGNQRTLKQFCEEEGIHYTNELWETYSLFKKVVGQIYDDLKNGSKHRSKYFEEIAEVVNASTLLDSLFTSSFTKADFLRLVCHISNLPLRVLRKYFNDPAMKEGDYWNEERLKKIFLREVRSWHPSGDEQLRKRRRRLIEALNESETMWDFWKKIDPVETIPPYEDMNNRRIPRCRTLYLSPRVLDQEYPLWREAIQKMLQEEPEMGSGLWGESCSSALQRQRIEEDKHLARVLQRFLDRAQERDPYAFRRVAHGNPFQDVSSLEALDHLERLIGPEAAVQLRTLAKEYFSEIEKAKKGLWDQRRSLFYRCDQHTKHKVNVSHLLIGDILGVPLVSEDVPDLLNFLRQTCVQRKTLLKIMEECSKKVTQKGNLLRSQVEVALYKRSKNLELNEEESSLLSLVESVEVAAQEIARAYGLVDEGERIANIWSFAQIYNILEKDRHGFSSLCEACHEENAFRSRVSDGAASFVRLVADSVRPFDGVVARLVEKQAGIISKQMIAYLREKGLPRGSQERFTLILEQNEFSFEEELRDLKKKPKEKESLKEDEFYKSKFERIVSFNQHCPYTGEIIENGDIDHILPRSWTRRMYNAVFNDELNLIYASVRGNREVKLHYPDGICDFEHLHENFLGELYPGNTREEIKDLVWRTIQELGIDRQQRIVFSRLDNSQKRDLRIALFIPEYRQYLIPYLFNALSAKVNGTQAYLAKRIVAKVRKAFPSLKFAVIKVPSDSIYQQRSLLARENPIFKKEDVQSLYSHVIDAVIATGIVENVEDYHTLLPRSVGTISIESKSSLYKKKIGSLFSTRVFKDGIYGEKFVPVLVYRGKLYFGFSLNNALRVPGGSEKAFFECLAPFLRYQKNSLSDTAWETWVQASQERLYRFFVNKQKAFEFYEKVAKNPPTEEEKKVFHLLEGLRYTTQRCDVSSLLIKNNTYQRKEELLKEGNFAIKIDIPSMFGCRALKGTLFFPGRASIERFLELPTVSQALGQKISECGIKIEDILREAKENIFHPYGNRNPGEPRVKARKVFAFDCLKKPSGGVRVRRKTPEGRFVYQVVDIYDRLYVGLEIVNGRFGESLIHQGILEAPGCVPVGYLYRDIRGDIVLMDEWRELLLSEEEKKKVQRVWVCPGTENRSYYRLGFSREQFFAHIVPYLGDQDLRERLERTRLEFYKLLPSEVKLRYPDHWELYENLSGLLVVPRKNDSSGKIKIVEASEDLVIIHYEANGFMPGEAQRRYIESLPH